MRQCSILPLNLCLAFFFVFPFVLLLLPLLAVKKNNNHSKLSTECQNIEMVRSELLQCDSQFQCGTAYQFVASLLLFPENIKTGCNVNGNVAFLHTIQDFMNAMNLNRNFSGFLVADSVFSEKLVKIQETHFICNENDYMYDRRIMAVLYCCSHLSLVSSFRGLNGISQEKLQKIPFTIDVHNHKVDSFLPIKYACILYGIRLYSVQYTHTHPPTHSHCVNLSVARQDVRICGFPCIQQGNYPI